MTTRPDAPADTTMMRIVHDALRRDLGRAQAALTGSPPPAARQRRAIARHLGWMMRFLHAHHRSEDVGLFPLVRQRDTSAADLLDAMHADHEAVAVAIADVEASASAASEDPDASGRLVAALGRLEGVLLPHLQREEDELLPVVSSTLTDVEWRALEKEHNLDPKSFVELGREGHWLLDDTSPTDRAHVVGLVPPIPRFILLHGFGRPYRRRAARCWGGPLRPRRRVQTRGRCQVEVDHDLDTVWDVVKDVARTGDWSHECVSITWLDGATAAVPGARFRGRNRSGMFRWGRICEIATAEPYELVWRTVPTTLYPDSTEWAIRLHPRPGGTTIEQTFEVIRAPKVLAVLYALMIPAHRDRTDALTEDLQRLGALAARPTGATVPAATR